MHVIFVTLTICSCLERMEKRSISLTNPCLCTLSPWTNSQGFQLPAAVSMTYYGFYGSTSIIALYAVSFLVTFITSAIMISRVSPSQVQPIKMKLITNLSLLLPTKRQRATKIMQHFLNISSQVLG